MGHVRTPETGASGVRTASGAVQYGMRFTSRWYLPIALFIDIAGTALPVALVFRAGSQPYALRSATVAALAWLSVQACRHRYGKRLMGESRGALPVLHDWLILLGVLAVLRAAANLRHGPLLCLTALLPSLLLTLARHKLTYHHLAAARRKAQVVTRVLVVGEPSAADDVAEHLAGRTDHPYIVVGIVATGAGEITSGSRLAGRMAFGSPVVTGEDTQLLLATAQKLQADVVMVAAGASMSGERLRRLSWGLHDAGVELSLAPGLVEISVKRLQATSAAGMALLRIVPPVRRGVQPVLKCVMDRGGAALGLVVLSPLFLLIALAVRLDSAGPVFYRQERIGQRGTPFVMWKFRTMHRNADARKVELAAANEVEGPMFKIRRDPRVTRVGRLLRRASLDELPQLINVTRGDMSLVGPRPPLPEEVALYNEVEARRLAVRPGMTGLWQISGRSDLSWEETVQLDLRYVDNWSFTSDVDVMARTLRAVVDGRGAY
jgi:exopolysaccharide biosynthesis polyprenyl glycosylphosphotransferase